MRCLRGGALRAWMRAAAMLLCLGLLLGGCGGHEMEEPSLDISGMQEAESRNGGFVINGVTYEFYSTAAALADPEYYDCEVPEGLAVGEPQAYIMVEHFYCYFAEIAGLEPDQWLIYVTDDQSGTLNLSTGAELYKAVSVHEIPAWIEDARRAYQESIAPGSYQGPAEGDTVVQ